MKKLLLPFLALSGVVFSAPIITVTPALGPDSATSSNFASFAQNVINGMRFGLPQGSGVSAYLPLANGSTLSAANFLSSGPYFNSWQGQTPGAFSGETGTVLYFGLKIVDSNGSATFSLNDVSVTETYLGTLFGTSSIAGTDIDRPRLASPKGMFFSLTVKRRRLSLRNCITLALGSPKTSIQR